MRNNKTRYTGFQKKIFALYFNSGDTNYVAMHPKQLLFLEFQSLSYQTWSFLVAGVYHPYYVFRVEMVKHVI